MWATLLRVENPACAWCHEATLSGAGVKVRVLAHFPANDGTVHEEVEISGSAWKETIDRIRKLDTVNEVEILETSGDGARLRMRVAECPLPHAVNASGVMPRFPFSVRQGSDEWLLVAGKEETTKFVHRIRQGGTNVEVLFSRLYRQDPGATSHQRKLMEAAIDQGYYEVPRRVTLTKLAERLGMAKSTLSEVLARGEKHLLEDLHASGNDRR
jgi:predicted DNA binding protein